MLDFAGINYCAVGSFWYSPAGFGRYWTKLSGVDMKKIPQKDANRAIVYVVLSSLLQAFVLAVVLNTIGTMTAAEGFITGMFIAL